MELLIQNGSNLMNVTVVTEFITETWINFTDGIYITSSDTGASPTSTYSNLITSVLPFKSENTSSTSGITLLDTTIPFMESISCRPGTPNVRHVCQDPLFYPYVGTFFMFAFGFIMIAAVVMNSLVLFVMARSTRARKSSHNVYAASLAFSDLLVVLIECPLIYLQFLLPGDISKVIFNPEMVWVCLLSFFFNSFFGTASIMTQLALNIDRYCMIIHPLTTRAFAKPTKTRAGFILVLVWSVSMIPQFGNIFLFKEVASESYVMHGASNIYQVHFCLSRKPSDNPYTPHVYTAVVFCIFYLSTLVTTLGLYVKIVFSLRQRKPTTTADDDRIYSIYIRRDSVHVNRQKIHRAASRNILRIMGCSVLSYCFCYSIYFYINLYYIYFGFLRYNGFSLLVIANLMGALNALVNPILFACYSNEFKNMLCAKVGCCGQTTKRNERSIASSYQNSNGSDFHSNNHGRRASVYQTSSDSSIGSYTALNGNGVLPTRVQGRSNSESTTMTVLETDAVTEA